MTDDPDADLRDLQPRQPRILTLDLERLPGRIELDVWEGRDAKRWSYFHPDRWSVLPSTLCGSAKWHGQKRTMFVAAWENPKNPYHVAEQFWEWIDQADIIVTYNGKRADEKWLRNDWLIAGLARPSTYKHVDLYAEVRRTFGFESNSLRHVCERLGLESKWGHYNADEAKAAAAGNVAAQKRLAKYNRTDSIITEQLYDYLGGWITSHPAYGMWTGVEKSCHRCGSEHLTRIGRAAAATTAYAEFRCEDCGALNRNNYRLTAVTQRVSR